MLMIKKFIGLPVAIMLLAGLACAGNIDSLHVQLGSWNGTQFIGGGSDWNTFSVGNWAIGATAPGYGNPLLTSYSPALDQFSLPDGEYWLYMAEYSDPSNAIQITLGYQGGGSVVEVFTAPASAEYSGPYTRVSGTAFTADLISGPQSLYTPVAPGQAYQSNSTPNWIVDVNTGSGVPEPGSWPLAAAGLTVLAGLRRLLARIRKEPASC